MSQSNISDITISVTDLPARRGDRSAAGNSESRDRNLRKTCADFEAIFVYRLLEIMRKTVPGGGLFSGKGGLGNDNYRMLFDQKLAEALTSQGRGLGLQHMLYEQMKKVEVREEKD